MRVFSFSIFPYPKYWASGLEMNNVDLFNLFSSLIFFFLPWSVSDKHCPIWADTVETGLRCWGAGHWLSTLMCLPLVSTCLRRVRAGSTTWLLLCLSQPAKVWLARFFTLTTLPRGLSSSLASAVWACCPLIMWPSDGVMAQGETRSWQPFPLMAAAELPEALSSSGELAYDSVGTKHESCAPLISTGLIRQQQKLNSF